MDRLGEREWGGGGGVLLGRGGEGRGIKMGRAESGEGKEPDPT